MVQETTHGYVSDLKRIDDGIDHIRVGAATALYDAVYLASRSLDHRKGRKVMVLITDGGDTISKVDYKEAVRAAEEAEAIVYSIIIVPIESSAGRETGGEHALIQLSEDTGGSTTTRPRLRNWTRRSAKSATNCGRNIFWRTIHRSAPRFRNFAGSRSK